MLFFFEEVCFLLTTFFLLVDFFLLGAFFLTFFSALGFDAFWIEYFFNRQQKI